MNDELQENESLQPLLVLQLQKRTEMGAVLNRTAESLPFMVGKKCSFG